MIHTNGGEPRAAYTQRLEARLAEAGRHERRHRTLGNLRLLVFLAAVLLGWLALGPHTLSPWWLAAPAAVFIVLAVIHDRVLRRRAACERAAGYYRRALARIDGHWAGTGEAGERYRDPSHPYADDLDLFGKASLFELLSTARTPKGEDLLAAWLLAPSPPAVVVERHAAVQELRPRLDLREDLAVLGEEVRGEVHADALASWGEGAPLVHARAERAAAVALTAFAVVSGVVWAVWGLRVFFLVAAAADFAYIYRMRPRVARVVAEVEGAAHGLAMLARVLVRLEREKFASPRLAGLRARLDVEGDPPSRRIARLGRLMELLDSRDNWAVRLLGPFVLYTEHLAFALESWRRRSGPAVRRWIDAVGEMEALSSLAGYAYEHPADPFPEFSPEGPWLEGEGLRPSAAGGGARRIERRAHRRRPAGARGQRLEHVRQEHAAARHGANVVLALAGAPVRARRMRLSPLPPGASIRVTDSLQGGSPGSMPRSRACAASWTSRRAGPRAVPARRDPARHQLARPADRRRGDRARAGRARRHRPVTTHDLALAHIADCWRRARPTCTSKTSWKTAKSTSTTACGPAWCERATRWS